MKALSQQNFIQQLSIDCVIFGYKERQLKVLVPKLNFKGDCWALPSGLSFNRKILTRLPAEFLRKERLLRIFFWSNTVFLAIQKEPVLSLWNV